MGSIFVEKVMDTAKPNPHEVLAQVRAQAKVDAAEMRDYFVEFDEDGTGALNRDEWMKLIEKGSLAEFMALREVDIKNRSHGTTFFDMAEAEYHRLNPKKSVTGEVTIENLVSTFLMVKGFATSMELAVAKHDLEARLKALMKNMEKLTTTLLGKPKPNVSSGPPKFSV